VKIEPLIGECSKSPNIRVGCLYAIGMHRGRKITRALQRDMLAHPSPPHPPPPPPPIKLQHGFEFYGDIQFPRLWRVCEVFKINKEKLYLVISEYNMLLADNMS
jgi:hypothetical protein